MSIHIPKDPFSLNTQHNPLHPHEPLQPESSSVSFTKDSVEAAPKEEEKTSLSSLTSSIPKLSRPTGVSLAEFSRILLETTQAFRHQLSASKKINIEMRRKASLLAAAQAQEFSDLIIQKQTVLQTLKQEIQEKLKDFQTILDEMQKLTQQHQQEIDKINSKNKLEKTYYEELTRAYHDYISNLEKIGAVDQGNGLFFIPEEAKEQYNQLTIDYQKAVAKFNDYWKERSQQIQDYNASTSTYNQKIAEYNNAVNEFLNRYHLFDEIKRLEITIPQLAPVNRRDLSDYQNQLTAPFLLISAPSVISVYPLPQYIELIAEGGPPALPKINPFSSFDAQILYHAVFKNLYESRLAFFDQAIMQYTSFLSFILNENLQNLDREISKTSFLNSKILARKLLHVSSTLSSSSLALQAIGIENPHLQLLFGQALLKEVIENAHLKALEELKDEEKEGKIEQWVQHFLLLSIGLLGNQSTHALFPSLGILSESLSSLPTDSSAPAILFTLSLINRIQEDINQGISTEALNSFLNANPELSSLSSADKGKLEAALHIGQLFIATKLLEDNMGLKGLMIQLLSFTFPHFDLTSLIIQAEQENQEAYGKLQMEIKDHFIQEGYSEDKGQFLGGVGAELTKEGLLTPQLTSHISPTTIQQSLLEHSIQAELVLTGYSLNDAHKITQEAISQTFKEKNSFSSKQFRATLEMHLTDLNVKNSSEIAMNAILIPSKTVFTPASNPAEFLSRLETEIVRLLTPQLGVQIVKEINEEMAKTFFGTPHSDFNDLTPSSPYGLVYLLKEQLHLLHMAKEENWSHAMHQMFKESIKTMESFYAFSLKLMDPAYLFLSASGIMYGNQATKKHIDIPI